MNPSDLSSLDLENLSLSDFPPGIVACSVIGALIIYTGLWAIICTFLSRSVRAIPEDHRKIGVGGVWLLLIPFFNAAWLFVVTRRVSASWKSFFTENAEAGSVGGCAKTPGLWWALTNAFCTIAQFVMVTSVQVLGLVVSLASFILMIVYLILINDLRHKAEKARVESSSTPTSFSA